MVAPPPSPRPTILIEQGPGLASAGAAITVYLDGSLIRFLMTSGFIDQPDWPSTPSRIGPFSPRRVASIVSLAVEVGCSKFSVLLRHVQREIAPCWLDLQGVVESLRRRAARVPRP